MSPADPDDEAPVNPNEPVFDVPDEPVDPVSPVNPDAGPMSSGKSDEDGPLGVTEPTWVSVSGGWSWIDPGTVGDGFGVGVAEKAEGAPRLEARSNVTTKAESLNLATEAGVPKCEPRTFPVPIMAPPPRGEVTTPRSGDVITTSKLCHFGSMNSTEF